MHFQTLRNKTKSVLSIKESYSLKKSQNFTNAYGQAGGNPPLSPHYGQPDRKFPVFVFYPLS